MKVQNIVIQLKKFNLNTSEIKNAIYSKKEIEKMAENIEEYCNENGYHAEVTVVTRNR